jgi:hypothetical protein
MNESSVYFSTDLSILAQIITGVIGVNGLLIKLDPQHQILSSVLGLEMIVQAIELFFYIFIIRKLPVDFMASTRYYDWLITTPTMLISSITYFKYEEYLEKQKNSDNPNEYPPLEFFKFIDDNKNNIISIVICNFFMLLFGYLGEIGSVDLFSAAIFGFAFFFMCFYIIYKDYAKNSESGRNLFNILFFAWATYGFAYLFDPVYKNIIFNNLDIISKNFFGIYLYYKITQKSI